MIIKTSKRKTLELSKNFSGELCVFYTHPKYGSDNLEVCSTSEALAVFFLVENIGYDLPELWQLRANGKNLYQLALNWLYKPE